MLTCLEFIACSRLSLPRKSFSSNNRYVQAAGAFMGFWIIAYSWLVRHAVFHLMRKMTNKMKKKESSLFVEMNFQTKLTDIVFR